MVKSCGECFHRAIASKPFMSELKSIISKRTKRVHKGKNSSIKFLIGRKSAEMLLVWKESFKDEHHYTIFAHTYSSLIEKGVVFPVTPSDRIAKPVKKGRALRESFKESNVPAEVEREINIVMEMAKMIDDLLLSRAAKEVIDEISTSLKEKSAIIMSLIDKYMSNEKALFKLLNANDRIEEVMERANGRVSIVSQPSNPVPRPDSFVATTVPIIQPISGIHSRTSSNDVIYNNGQVQSYPNGQQHVQPYNNGQQVQTYPNNGQQIQTYPNNGQQVQTYPISSQQVQTYPNTQNTQVQTYPHNGQQVQTYPNTQNTQVQTYPNQQVQTYPNTQGTQVQNYPNQQVQTYPNNGQVQNTQQVQTYPNNSQVQSYPNNSHQGQTYPISQQQGQSYSNVQQTHNNQHSNQQQYPYNTGNNPQYPYNISNPGSQNNSPLTTNNTYSPNTSFYNQPNNNQQQQQQYMHNYSGNTQTTHNYGGNPQTTHQSYGNIPSNNSRKDFVYPNPNQY